MKIKTAYPLIINGKVVANGNYEGGFANAQGRRRITARTRPKPRQALNPDESPSDVQARNLIDGASYFDGDIMNSYADASKEKSLFNLSISKEQLLNIGALGAFLGIGYLLFIKTK